MSKVILSNCQQEALDGFIDFIDSPDPWMIISGFAGSGKSFLVEYMTEVADNVLKLQQHLSVAYKAPVFHFTATTNKAAAVLTQMLGQEARTIHSLLGLKLTTNYDTGKQRLVRKKGRKVRATANSIIFIDEASMINRELMHYIKKYQESNKGCKIVFIGDPYQLPPVKEDPCNVFNAPEHHFFLDKIQRQVAGSPIIQLSAKYREVLDKPELPWPRIESDGEHIFFYDKKIDFDVAIATRMGKTHDPQQHKVLAWKNDTVRDYNTWLRKMHGYTEPFELNEVFMTNKPIISGNQIWAPTDSLVRIEDIEEHEASGIKGYMLLISAVNRSLPHLKIFQPADWKKVKPLSNAFANDKNWQAYYYIKEQWADLRPIHALTVHKSQGSTYKEVFVDLKDIGLNTRWQETARLAYVAITRASDRLHIYGSISTDHSTTKQKNTVLERFKNVEHLL